MGRWGEEGVIKLSYLTVTVLLASVVVELVLLAKVIFGERLFLGFQCKSPLVCSLGNMVGHLFIGTCCFWMVGQFAIVVTVLSMAGQSFICTCCFWDYLQLSWSQQLRRAVFCLPVSFVVVGHVSASHFGPCPSGGDDHGCDCQQNDQDVGSLDARPIRVGQTCYLNSFTQGLASNAPFVDFMKQSRHCRTCKTPKQCAFCAIATLMNDLSVVNSQNRFPLLQGIWCSSWSVQTRYRTPPPTLCCWVCLRNLLPQEHVAGNPFRVNHCKTLECLQCFSAKEIETHLFPLRSHAKLASYLQSFSRVLPHVMRLY